MNPLKLLTSYNSETKTYNRWSYLLTNNQALNRLKYNLNYMQIGRNQIKQKQSLSSVIKQQLFQSNGTYQIKSTITSIITNNKELEIQQSNETEKNFKYDYQGQTKSYQLINCLKNCYYQANEIIQDTIEYCKIINIGAIMISVFDGHGGFQLSNYCSKNISSLVKSFIGQNLQKYLSNKILLISKALQWAYQQLQDSYYEIYKSQMKKNNKKLYRIGTCAITAVLFKGHIIVANSGDSQAMVISQKQNNYNYKKLSERYSVNNQSERIRLAKQFGKTDPNIYSQQRKNVYYLKGVLQPTKSIGDYYLKKQQFYTLDGQFNGPYLSCKPAITVHKILPEDKTFIIASDGLWDYMSKWEILKTVVQCKKTMQLKKNNSQLQTQSDAESYDNEDANQLSLPQRLVDKILQKSADQCDMPIQFLKKLKTGERRNYHDDISILTVDLEQYFKDYEQNAQN